MISNLRLFKPTTNIIVISKRIISYGSLSNLNLEKEKKVNVNYLSGEDNGIVVMGLNRPEVKNALNKTFLSELNNALNIIRNDNNIRVLIIRSLVSKIFCSGADLNERLKMNQDQVKDFVNQLSNFMSNVESMPMPVICALDGTALGGGLELALATDIRVAAQNVKMGLVETKLAIIPGAGGTQRLPRLIGPAKAKELIYLAKIIDGKEAEQLGLVNHAVLQNKFGDAAYEFALDMAREILPNGPISIRLAKDAINQGIQVPMKDGLEIEQNCYHQLLPTKDRIEGLTAFSVKRVPIYRGI